MITKYYNIIFELLQTLTVYLFISFIHSFSATLVEYLHILLRPVIDVPLLFTQSEVIMLLSTFLSFKTCIMGHEHCELQCCGAVREHVKVLRVGE